MGKTDEVWKTVLKKLCVGRRLYKLVSEPALITESKGLYRGFYGYLLKQYLTHPLAGTRLANIDAFAKEVGLN